jgi:hypothetical protein
VDSDVVDDFFGGGSSAIEGLGVNVGERDGSVFC